MGTWAEKAARYAGVNWAMMRPEGDFSAGPPSHLDPRIEVDTMDAVIPPLIDESEATAAE